MGERSTDRRPHPARTGARTARGTPARRRSRRRRQQLARRRAVALAVLVAIVVILVVVLWPGGPSQSNSAAGVGSVDSPAVAVSKDGDGIKMATFLGTLTGAMSTWWVFCNMGVTTMKMIKSTSMMSAIGIRSGPPSVRRLLACKP